MKNDESLLYFEDDLGHIIPAESVLLDALAGDVKKLQSELIEVIKIVTKDADRIEQSGDVTQLTLAELVEQKSIVQNLGETPHQLGSSSRLSGRTPMERFSMNAKVACEQALESINSVQTKYILVLGYFGEDEQMPTGDFFGTLRRFMTEWKKATKQVEKIERRKVRARIHSATINCVIRQFFQANFSISPATMFVGKGKETRGKESSKSEKESERVEEFLSEEREQ